MEFDVQNIFKVKVTDVYMYSILQLIEKHGFEAERHLFRCLFSFIDFAGDGKNNGKDFLQVSGYAVGWYMTVFTQKSATLERTETEDHKIKACFRSWLT